MWREPWLREVERALGSFFQTEGNLMDVLSLKMLARILDPYDINRLLNSLIFRNRGKEQTPPYPLR